MSKLAQFALLSLASLTVTLLIGQRAEAVLIAQDSFDFGGGTNYLASPAGRNGGTPSPDGRTVPSTATAQNPTTTAGFVGGSLGGTNAWKGANTSLWQVQNTGLSYVGQPSSGGSIQYDWNGTDLTRIQYRPLTTPPTVIAGNTYWISGMVRYNALETDNKGAAYIGFGNTSSGGNFNPDTTTGTGFFAENPKGLRFGVEATGSGGRMNLVLRHQNTGGIATSDILASSIAPAVTQLVLIKAEVGAAAGNDKISVWVNPTSVGGQIQIADADYTFIDSSFASASALNLLLIQGFDIDNISGAGGVVFDEIRLGTSFFDVIPNGIILQAPEPSTLALLGGVFVLAARRRRKSSM